MKKFRKMIAVVLAITVAMTMGIATTSMAFAADAEYQITVQNTTTSQSINGKEYKAYKVFDLTLGDAKQDGTYGAYAYSIKNTDWAWETLTTGATTDSKGVITTTYGITLTPSATDSTKYTVDGESMTDANARALADALTSKLPSTADGSATGANEKAVIDLTEAGYYAIYGTVKPTDPKASEEVVAAVGLNSTDKKVTVEPKVEVPPLDKKITGEHVLDAAGKAATAEIGKTVSFQLDSKVPDLTGYSDYTFKLSDTMTSGLTFTDPAGDATNDVVVKINNVDKTTDTTVKIEGQTLTVTIPYNTLKAATKGQDIVVTYSAVVNANALTTDYEKNTAKLTYSNNPTTNTTNETPDKEVYVIDVNIDVDKVDGEGSDAGKLKDAEFVLFKGATQPADTDAAWYKYDETNGVVTWVTKANADVFKTVANTGKLDKQFRGLEAEKNGTKYGLLETKAPEGYNLPDEPIIVTLTGAYNAQNSQATITAQNATVEGGTINVAENPKAQPVATAKVVNRSGSVLPSTGGIGTTIFYILGALLVVGCGIILIARRRMGANS